MSRTLRFGFLAGLVGVMVVAGLREWARPAVTPAMAEEALAAGFEDALRNLVIRWDPSDLRPDSERYRNPDDARLGEAELLSRHGDDRDWFNTERPGSSNAGHDVWERIGSDENRRALIEFLKTP